VRLSILASGSGGNALVVEADGTVLLLDCGISFRQLRERMAGVGLAPAQIDAVCVSHEHEDHVKGLEVFARHHPVPVHATAGTAAGMPVRPPLAAPLRGGRAVRVGALSVLPVPTSHDAREPVGFVLEHRGCRVGVATDTGVVTELLLDRFAGCRALLLEHNHDRDLLRVGPYPWPLKQRILSRTGHLSNEQASEALDRLAHTGLEVVVAMHLSETNNRPEIVRSELHRRFGGSGVRIEVAAQDETVTLTVGEGAAPAGQLELFPRSAAVGSGGAARRRADRTS